MVGGEARKKMNNKRVGVIWEGGGRGREAMKKNKERPENRKRGGGERSWSR